MIGIRRDTTSIDMKWGVHSLGHVNLTIWLNTAIYVCTVTAVMPCHHSLFEKESCTKFNPNRVLWHVAHDVDILHT